LQQQLPGSFVFRQQSPHGSHYVVMTPHHKVRYALTEDKCRMSGKFTQKHKDVEGGLYEIRVHGHLDDRWTGWFEGLTLTLEQDGNTLIRGQVVDQAALFGLLRKVRDTGMLLVSVQRVNASRVDRCGDKT
jgi:hypothetical protein